MKVAQTEEELAGILRLRYKILRAPWDQSPDTATDALENSSLNAFIEGDNKEVIACGRLQENDNKIGQIRFMAVDNAFQGQGLGRQLVVFLEEQARDMKLQVIELQARENALDFYKSCGYSVKEKSFLLWGQIQHYRMEKKLANGQL